MHGGGGRARRSGEAFAAVVDLSTEAVERSAQLMAKHADRPMDLADATLVAIAEEEGHRKVCSLDSDFHIYRIRGRHRFDVVPRRA